MALCHGRMTQFHGTPREDRMPYHLFLGPFDVGHQIVDAEWVDDAEWAHHDFVIRARFARASSRVATGILLSIIDRSKAEARRRGSVSKYT